MIDFENIQLLSKDVSRTNASADYLYSPLEVLLGRLQGETNTTIPFYALGKIGIRMAIGSESAFEELHSHQSSEDYLFPTLVSKALENKCTPAFIQTVVMATLPNIKDRFSSWKLMHQALEKGVAGKSLPKRLTAALKHLMTTPIANPFSSAAAILRGDRVIQKAPEYQIVAGEKPKLPRASEQSTSNTEPVNLPTPPPLMPMNVTGIRKNGPYFEIETDDMVYAIEAERTDGGKSRTQDDWVAYFQQRGDGTQLPTPGEILRIVVALQQQLAQNSKDEVALELKAKLIEDFRKHWMMTGARISYSKTEGDSVIQHYRGSDEQVVAVKKFWGPDNWLVKQSDRDMIAHSLFDAQPDEVESAFKWLTAKDSYVWRVNNPWDGQRPVVLGLVDGSNRFDVGAYVGDLVSGRPARGVARRKKI